ncbi:MAG: purine-nucleoside phosphorylase [Flavobacteriales bacterium]|nr:purine-nucleoside phosphorylase [Flavobacteriales bacterium]MCB9447188.1 purine-nucleoside phosphorylase [Flavobacteriales bacterium]
MSKEIQSAVDYILSQTDFKPRTGIVLGTGLGALSKEITIQARLPYKDIPHFPLSTVESHSGNLLFGEINHHPVVAMEGRFHYYEGYSMQEVVFPIRVMKHLGIERLIVSNASGGLNPSYEKGDLMIISDHISQFLPDPPLRGKHNPEWGPRFPDLLHAYDPKMRGLALELAATLKIRAHEGVYVAVPGPHLESPAEYKMLRMLGADAVGMSTVPEVIAARQMGLPCFAISIITDLGVEGRIEEVSIEKVIAVASQAEPKMTAVMKALISSF